MEDPNIIMMRVLYLALKRSWGRDTVRDGDAWSCDCPELNQCAITAIVVQDHFGGQLLRCPTKDGGSHYWNRLPDGREVDFTVNQFLYSGDWPLKDEVVIRTRDYLESNENTMIRYHYLREKVLSYMSNGLWGTAPTDGGIWTQTNS